jgi:threonine dehydrogenase-like Zn-dependent dehydrogenase
VPVNIATIVKKELMVFGSCYGSFQDAVALLADNTFEIDDLLGNCYRLEDFEKAVSISDCQGSAKTFFDLQY